MIASRPENRQKRLGGSEEKNVYTEIGVAIEYRQHKYEGRYLLLIAYKKNCGKI